MDDELCAALVIVGAENASIDDVEESTLRRLDELGLIHWNAGSWELTPPGTKLLPRLQEGKPVEFEQPVEIA
jgi:hypothetical protein